MSEEKCYISPFKGRCVVERVRAADRAGNIWIPDKAKVMPTIGKVVAVGDEEQDYLVGKRVIFGRMSGVPISVANKPLYSIFAYEELLAILNTEDDIEFEQEDTSLAYQ